MVLYYTFKQKTKVFAEVLGEIWGQNVYALECDLNEKSDLMFMFHALKSCATRRSYPVSNMPSVSAKEIFVCSPVWGGELAAPVKYFLENADLRGVTVNILLTAGIPSEKYRQKALEFLNKIPCQQGDAYIFATYSKVPPEKDFLREHLREILCL